MSKFDNFRSNLSNFRLKSFSVCTTLEQSNTWKLIVHSRLYYLEYIFASPKKFYEHFYKLTSRNRNPCYNTFSSDSQIPKVNQVNNLCEYVPGKIISTHFYEQPTRKHNSSYNTINDSSYAHANNGASRHTSTTHTQTQQPRNNVHTNTRTQPNTVPHVMNSAPYNPSNIPITQGAHTSSYPTRRRSCCWSFCCICLLIMLIVVLLISIVVILCIHYL